MEQGLTLKTAAERLGIKPRTLRQWIADGRIPSVKIGRLWLIREAVINDILLGKVKGEKKNG